VFLQYLLFLLPTIFKDVDICVLTVFASYTGFNTRKKRLIEAFFLFWLCEVGWALNDHLSQREVDSRGCLEGCSSVLHLKLSQFLVKRSSVQHWNHEFIHAFHLFPEPVTSLKIGAFPRRGVSSVSLGLASANHEAVIIQAAKPFFVQRTHDMRAFFLRKSLIVLLNNILRTLNKIFAFFIR